MTNMAKQNIIPIAILSTVIVGSGIAWFTVKSSSSEKETGENKNLGVRAREAGEGIDKKEVKNGLQRSLELIKTTGVQMQTVYEKYGRDLIQQLQQIQQESKTIVETAKEASEEIEDTVQKEGKEAVQEVKKTKDEAKQSLSQDDKNQNSSYSHNPRGPFGSN
ncbi:hypothetical protein SAMN05421781_0042 [Marinococcus luteus]|uniref:Gas vesicle protein n=1 Tax=Marinococcus luteus TaxID=1122204 RepID=A0A1H2PZ18_9BACI|nr:hypothetical protein [Marinococcus luteus]SDW00105.1 hypothetical protein SAMN05421781_0042 [Marinococcus luteus]